MPSTRNRLPADTKQQGQGNACLTKVQDENFRKMLQIANHLMPGRCLAGRLATVAMAMTEPMGADTIQQVKVIPCCFPPQQTAANWVAEQYYGFVCVM